MILNHPRIPNVTVEVPDADVKRWTAQGWVGSEPEPEPAEAEATKRPKRTRKK